MGRDGDRMRRDMRRVLRKVGWSEGGGGGGKVLVYG